jgi:hypothetical protein
MVEVMNRRGYQVVVTRDDGAWLAEVSELVGASTFARTLPALDRSVREVIVLADDLPDEAIGELALDYEYRTGDPSIDERSAQVRALRSQAEELSARATADTEAAARELVEHGVPVRDAAALLGVSPQRISQMTGRSRAS